jgi:hypothetical protein
MPSKKYGVEQIVAKLRGGRPPGVAPAEAPRVTGPAPTPTAKAG